MKSLLFILLSLTLKTSLSFGAISLEESFESALKTNQTNPLADSIISQSLELKNQGQGAYLPKFSLKGTYLKQDKIDDSRAYAINLSHSLFKGGRDYYTVENSNRTIESAKNQKNTDQLSLYSNVISAYYNFYLYFNDYKNLELLKKQSEDRVEEIKKRVRVGRSRRGELLQAEAQLASAEALLFNGLGLLKESQERFYVLTGYDRTKEVSFAENFEIASDQKTLSQYLSDSLNRPDLKVKAIKIDIADIELSSNKALHLPTLDIGSNYYLNKRTGIYRNTKWDATLTLSIPLFEGGVTSAKVREGAEKKAQATYSFLDYKRLIELDVSTKFETYHRYLDQIKAFDLALEKAKKSYDETLNDYRLGLVSNLDVLSSLNLYLDSKRNNEKTKISALMSKKLLEASIGVMP